MPAFFNSYKPYLKRINTTYNLYNTPFYKILNANDCDPNLTADITRKLQNVQHDSNMAVSAKSITEIVSKLECAKSAGPDGTSAECFKFSDTKIHVLLSLLFSMCLSHGYLPSALIKTTIVPIVKKKQAIFRTAITIDQLQLLILHQNCLNLFYY